MNSVRIGRGSVSKIISPNYKGIMATSILSTGGQMLQIERHKDCRANQVDKTQMSIINSWANPYCPNLEDHFFSTQDYPTTIIIFDGEKMNNLAKIDLIAALQDNWNSEGAPAFQETIIASVRKIITCLDIQPEVFPTAANSIQLEYDGPNGSYLEIEIGEGKLASVFSIDREGHEDSAEISLNINAINSLVDAFYE